MPRKTASYTPAVKPARGIVVTLDGKPGKWQLSDQSPSHGGWWCVAMDDAAKAHANYTEATARDMTRA